MSAAVVAIIEDDAAVLDVMTECLTGNGYRILPYRQGAGAYELIEIERPDAVILDIRMEHPRAGLAVLQRLRRNLATVDLPVLICTGDASFAREWERTLEEYRCTVVAKPFQIADLLAAIGHLTQPPPDEEPATSPRNGRAKGQPKPPVIRPVIGLVDADGHGVATFTEQLERKGYKVVGCRWGDKLHDMAVREQPDLLIVDVGARRQGIVSLVLRRLRDDPLTSRIPFLLDPPKDRELYRTIEGIVGPPPLLSPLVPPPPRWRRV